MSRKIFILVKIVIMIMIKYKKIGFMIDNTIPSIDKPDFMYLYKLILMLYGHDNRLIIISGFFAEKINPSAILTILFTLKTH